MNLSRLALITITAALLATACNKGTGVSTTKSESTATPAASSGTPDEFAAARGTYAKRCSNCHGDNGQGGTAEIEGKKIKGPAFRTGHALNHLDVDFVKQITKGGDGMPPFGDKLSAKEIDDLVHFLRHEFQGGNSPHLPPAQMK